MRQRRIDLLSGGRHMVRLSTSERHRASAERAERREHHKDAPVSSSAAMSQDQDNFAQDAVLRIGQPIIQLASLNPLPGNNVAQGQVINVNLQPVGLLTKITIQIQGTFTPTAATQLTATQFGIANLLSNVQFTDLSNYQRVNTTGRHLHLLACLRRQLAAGASYQNDCPMNLGSSFRVNNAPNNMDAAGNFRFHWEIPVAYGELDLRGAVYLGVTSAVSRMQFTINPNAVVTAANTNPNEGCYQSTTADLGVLSNVEVRVYQHYIDQVPRANNGMPVLPLLRMSNTYNILNVASPSIVASQDFPILYSNFRTFLSTMLTYNNAGVLNPGTDINYLGIQVANQLFLEKTDPYMSQHRARNLIGSDPPLGTYIIDHRRKPINTIQWGNTSFVINAATAGAGAYCDMMYEMISVQAQAINAGSLAPT